MTEFWQGPALAKLMRAVHSESSMLVLMLLLFFAVTGITLNHPDWLYSKAGQQSRQVDVALPHHLRFTTLPDSAAEQANVAIQFRDWLCSEQQLKASVVSYAFEPDVGLLELVFKRPAGYATVLV
ncbi:PepSY-associated TM helix domain-containing protein, partial [Rheinheimera pleomorphica]|uniref:PepSY-associated TM helix domain-containing protein n=1 Tax=Rheinheimera pleomorphica TaxID=2703963 RepID=UPI002B247E00